MIATSIEHPRKKQKGIFSVFEVTDLWAPGKPPENDAQPREKEVPPLPVALWGPHGAWTSSRTGLLGLAEGLGKELVTWPQVCGLTGQHCHSHLLLRTQRTPYTSGTCMLPSSISQQKGLAGKTSPKVADPQLLSRHCSNSVPYVRFQPIVLHRNVTPGSFLWLLWKHRSSQWKIQTICDLHHWLEIETFTCQAFYLKCTFNTCNTGCLLGSYNSVLWHVSHLLNSEYFPSLLSTLLNTF